MADSTAGFVLIVFAKAPVPGEVKTRLIPALDAEHAAMLHAALTERALATALDSDADLIELCCAPDDSHSFFQSCAEDFEIELTLQGGGDLGERMLRVLERALSEFAGAIIIGADCPALTAKHIDAAAAALAKHDIALTPAEDGGYALIGARRTHPDMFKDISWGSGSVLEQQRHNLKACGLRWHEMETLWDVDRPADLPRLQALRPPLEFFWPA
ncbi:MAG TPA: TIGR04282 family arsenosugar biosynthesis glycosyltransferase [Usitatibacteraceae bacterium]